MSAPQVFVISPLDIALTAIASSFDELWPQAVCVNLLEESLYKDHTLGDPLGEHTIARIRWLFDYAIDSRADALIFTGSVFNKDIRKIRQYYDIPIITSFEGMIEDAFVAGSRIGVLTSAPQSCAALVADVEAFAATGNHDITIDARVAEGAMKAMFDDYDSETHDRLVAAVAADMVDLDALMLGQFSMGGAYAAVAPVAGRVVLTPPRSAALKVKRLLGA